MFSKLLKSKNKSFNQLLSMVILLIVGFSFPANALFVSPPKDPVPLIKEIFPTHTSIGEKTLIENSASDDKNILVWTVKNGDEILGYAFETNDLARIPAYSGEPVNMLIAIDTKGVYLGAKVLEHHEPIILAGIPESKLHAFTDQYTGLSVNDRLKVGGKKTDGLVNIDGLSGATVTVMVMNVAVVKAATKVGRALGIISASQEII